MAVRKGAKTLLSATTLLVALAWGAGCGPDNVGECEKAETALTDAYDQCSVDYTTDLQCDTYADYQGDCTEYFSTLASSAECGEDDVVTYDNTGPCTA